MGILPEGVPLSWNETKALAEQVQKHGVQQFINLYRKSKDRQGDPFKWGDEIEYMIVKFDDYKKEAKVSCKSHDLLTILYEKERNNNVIGLWRPEYGGYLIESSPIKPFEGPLTHFKTVETSMRQRRQEVQDLLDKDECIMTLMNSLRFGCKDFTYPAYEPKPDDPNSFTKSRYLSDEVLYSGHLRFHILSRNMRLRRGERAEVKLKVFKDEYTKLPIEGSPSKESDAVILDTTFGCNLQVTVQGSNLKEARYLYDQLAPLCPIIQAVTAASPIYRGYLTESDNSWNFIGSGSDDRSEEERGIKPLKKDKYRMKKQRWDSIDCYLTPEAADYNDIPLDYDQKVYTHLRNEGVDHALAQHVAHLFIRDPLVMFSGNIHQSDEEDTGHFDNINTSTWQTLRFKPALPNTDAGWRVEFRPCDIQLTDFENAAVSCFVILLTRVMIYFELNFLIPISKIDENMEMAQKKDACRKEKFWFRKNIRKSKKLLNGFGNCELKNGLTNGHCNNYHINGYTDGHNNTTNGHNEKEYELMTIDEIYNGKSDDFPGLISLSRSYLQSLQLDNETRCVIEQYITFIEKRASGDLPTNAMWMRQEVLNHPEYKQDSVVSEQINYDILKQIQKMQDTELISPR